MKTANNYSLFMQNTEMMLAEEDKPYLPFMAVELCLERERESGKDELIRNDDGWR